MVAYSIIHYLHVIPMRGLFHNSLFTRNSNERPVWAAKVEGKTDGNENGESFADALAI